MVRAEAEIGPTGTRGVKTLSEELKSKLTDLPDKPGCYLMRDRYGRIIYVGKAVSLRDRGRFYFRPATARTADPKLSGLIQSICDFDTIVVRNEAEAILTEGRLIKEYKPWYNVSFRDDKRFLQLRGEAGHPFPRFKVCRIRRDDGAVYFGPFASSRATRAALDFVEKTFGLRKCAPRLPTDETYRHCLNDIIRYCSAPCCGRVTEQAYQARFQEACAFLRGECLAPLTALKQEMDVAAAAMDFERAAALRDTWRLLHEVVKRRVRMAPTPETRREDGLAAVAALRVALDLTRAPRVIEAYDVSNISGTYSVAGMVCFVDGMARRNRYRRFRIQAIEGANDPAMMAEVIRRRFSRLVDEQQALPDLVLVDGGLTQVRAAQIELTALQLTDVPVAGLAKRQEEIYQESRDDLIRLAPDSPALKLLQHLRDEAHRFALTYHRHLRGQKIRESVLDEIPGIGKERKRALLGHFGSIRRLAHATEAQIAEVPGIGPSMARTIRRELQGAG